MMPTEENKHPKKWFDRLSQYATVRYEISLSHLSYSMGHMIFLLHCTQLKKEVGVGP
jgi:hypothetical protein